MALAITVLSALLAVAAVRLGLLNAGTPTPPGMSLGSKALEIAFPLLILSFPAVGLLITRRHPGHLVAWTFLSLGLGAEVLFAGQGYGLYGTVTAPNAVPGARWVLWLLGWSWAILSAALPVLLLVFPTGRLPSPRWKWAAIAAAVGAGFLALSDGTHAWQVVARPADDFFKPSERDPALEALYVGGNALWVLATLAAASSVVLRYRGARGEERQQIKWFAYAAVFAGVSAAAAGIWYADPRVGGIAAGAAAVAGVTIPIAAGIAILRYRLYDIDLVIERTVVYGAVSVLLLATYVTGVVVLQALLRPITTGSDLAVAGSTLSVVALFQPLRQWVQDAVDRRFYRARYDAARTLDAFGARLRNDVDLDSVRADLVEVIGETLRPTHASVWLRERTS